MGGGGGAAEPDIPKRLIPELAVHNDALECGISPGKHVCTLLSYKDVRCLHEFGFVTVDIELVVALLVLPESLLGNEKKQALMVLSPCSSAHMEDASHGAMTTSRTAKNS